jgi:hypothetical protein
MECRRDICTQLFGVACHVRRLLVRLPRRSRPSLVISGS